MVFVASEIFNGEILLRPTSPFNAHSVTERSPDCISGMFSIPKFQGRGPQRFTLTDRFINVSPLVYSVGRCYLSMALHFPESTLCTPF